MYIQLRTDRRIGGGRFNISRLRRSARREIKMLTWIVSFNLQHNFLLCQLHNAMLLGDLKSSAELQCCEGT